MMIGFRRQVLLSTEVFLFMKRLIFLGLKLEQ